MLLLHANEAVSRDRLVAALWPQHPPASADKIVQNHVSALRKVLPSGALETRGNGYRLVVGEGELDLDRFRAGLEDGPPLLAAGAAADAAGRLPDTLSLWRGEPLADCRLDGDLTAQSRSLAELHTNALERRIDADLAAGRHGELVGELESYVSASPYSERFREQLMLALYRARRQTEALAVYRDARAFFAADLGIEPSPSLRELEHRILNHDPTLDLRSAGSTRGLRRRWRLLLVAGGALVAAAGAAGIVEATRGARGGLDDLAPNSLAAIDPDTNRVVAEIPVGARPATVVAGEGSLWVANLDDRTVARVDPAADRVVRTISVGDAPADLAAGAGSVWTLGTAPRTRRAIVRTIDTRFDAVADQVAVHATCV